MNLTPRELADLGFPFALLFVSFILMQKGGRWLGVFIQDMWKFYKEQVVPEQQKQGRDLIEAQREVAKVMTTLQMSLGSVNGSIQGQINELRDDIRDGFVGMQGKISEIFQAQAEMNRVVLEMIKQAYGGATNDTGKLESTGVVAGGAAVHRGGDQLAGGEVAVVPAVQQPVEGGDDARDRAAVRRGGGGD